jgi:small conductance mechanosensitive channel
MTYIALLVFVVLAALGQLGVQTTSFIAVIGAEGISIPFPQREVHVYEHKE